MAFENKEKEILKGAEAALENLMDRAYVAYKKTFRKHCPGIAFMLDRKNDVVFEGITFNGWNEFIVWQIGRVIQEKLGCECEIVLDKNNSTLLLEVDDIDEEKVMQEIENLYS